MPKVIEDAGEVSRDSEMKVPPNLISFNYKKLLMSEALQSSDVGKKTSHEVSSNFKVNHVLKKASLTYELEKFRKNALLIFNTMHVKYYAPRYGTEMDVKELTATFSRFGFEVNVQQNLKKAEVMKTLREFSAKDFSEYGCIAVAVLTHGSEAGLLAADGKYYTENDIIHNFKCNADNPTLITKPKIFIIQACRGMKSSVGVEVTKPGAVVIPNDTEETPYSIPVDSDMIILHSSFQGNLSFRNVMRGSWFIQSLCKNINNLAETYDLESILTEVKREVAIGHSHVEFSRNTSDFQTLKQMPVVTSTLIRKLYLRTYTMDKPVQVQSDTGSPTEQTGCQCYLKHFDYMRNCLKFYLEDHPNDTIGKSLYNMAKVFHGPLFNEPKKKMLVVIVEHLRSNKFEYFKYLHIYYPEMCESHHNDKQTDKQTEKQTDKEIKMEYSS